MPWLRQIEDHIGPQAFEEMLNNGQLEPAHLSTLRGRDLKNCILFVDEAENLLVSNIQLLIGRMAENSEIIFCADVKQCDYQDEKMSGIPKMIERLAGDELFGMVKLIKTERSATAARADFLD
jgi:predicted ribonuclease YlaK